MFIGLLGFSQSVSPEVVNSSGGVYSNSNNTILFSVGETAITPISSANNAISQGFLQSKPSLLDITESSLESNLTIYPNPSTDLIYFKNLKLAEELSIKVFDRMGKVVSEKIIKNQSLDVSSFSEGVYQVVIYDKKNNVLHRETFFKIR